MVEIINGRHNLNNEKIKESIDDQFARFIKGELQRRGLKLFKLATALNTTTSYLDNYLERKLRDGKPRSITIRKAGDMLHALGLTWYHFHNFLRKEERCQTK